MRSCGCAGRRPPARSRSHASSAAVCPPRIDRSRASGGRRIAAPVLRCHVVEVAHCGGGLSGGRSQRQRLLDEVTLGGRKRRTRRFRRQRRQGQAGREMPSARVRAAVARASAGRVGSGHHAPDPGQLARWRGHQLLRSPAPRYPAAPSGHGSLPARRLLCLERRVVVIRRDRARNASPHEPAGHGGGGIVPRAPPPCFPRVHPGPTIATGDQRAACHTAQLPFQRLPHCPGQD